MAAYKAMVRANDKREVALRGAELVTILGIDPGTLSEHELRSIYMSSLGAAAHGSVEAAANALGVSTTDYFLAGGAAGVRGLTPQEIRDRAFDVRRRGGLSAATAGGAHLVDILGGDANDFSEHELRSIYMSSLGVAAHGSVEAAANVLGVSTTDYFLAGGAAGVRGLNARQIQAKARDVRDGASATAGGDHLVADSGANPDDFSASELRSIHMGSLGAAAHASAAAGNRPLGGATKVSAPSRTLLIANCEVTNRLYAVSRQKMCVCVVGSMIQYCHTDYKQGYKNGDL